MLYRCTHMATVGVKWLMSVCLMIHQHPAARRLAVLECHITLLAGGALVAVREIRDCVPAASTTWVVLSGARVLMHCRCAIITAHCYHGTGLYNAFLKSSLNHLQRTI